MIQKERKYYLHYDDVRGNFQTTFKLQNRLEFWQLR